MAKYPPGSHDGGSLFSDMDSLEDTDEFGRKLLQHTKDAQRISNLQAHAFRKAKPLPRAALNIDNLERNSLRHPPAHATDPHRPPSVASSNTSDPPLNPPREWGRKGRHDRAWMRRIYTDDQRGDQSPNIDWVDAANDHLSPAQRRAGTASTPPSLSHNQNNQLDQWECDQDFSAVSLLASTPDLPSRSRLTVEQIRRREIETFTSSDRQAQQQTPSETLRRHVSTSAQGSKTSIANKENVPLHPRHSPNGFLPTVEPSESAARTSQRRTDSLALLKRLSRTPSASSSPVSSGEAAAPVASARRAPTQSEESPLSNYRSARWDSPQAPEVVRGPEPVHLSQGDSSQAPEVVEVPERQKSGPAATPMRPADQLPAQTPKVMGAWVDTPQTTARTTDYDDATPQAGEIVSDAHRPRTCSEPNLPLSALDAVLKNLRDGTGREDDDPTIGDSTIASLEEVMNPSADTTLRLNLPDVPAAQPQSYLQGRNKKNGKQPAQFEEQAKKTEEKDSPVDTVPTTQQQRDDRQKWFALEALKERFRGIRAKAKPTIDVPKRKPSDQTTESSPVIDSAPITVAPHQHTAGAHCAYCGRPRNVFRAMWTEYWGLYLRRSRPSALGFRLTTLGLICALLWLWLITELTLSAIFEPPLYAATMQGYGVDPNAPRFPYVLPTLMYRPLSPVIGPIGSLALMLWKAVVGEQQWRYYPASPGVWGPAARVRIKPPRPGSAYYTPASYEQGRWSESTAKVVHSAGQVREMDNIWSQGQLAWEGDESMLDDEVL